MVTTPSGLPTLPKAINDQMQAEDGQTHQMDASTDHPTAVITNDGAVLMCQN